MSSPQEPRKSQRYGKQGGHSAPRCGRWGRGSALLAPLITLSHDDEFFPHQPTSLSHSQAQGKSVTHCAGAAPECAALRATLFHCKRSSVDARSRIQGNKLDR
jgi:hypothetical protein